MEEELEKEIQRYNEEQGGDCRYVQTARHFARWMREQMMKEAVDAEVVGEQRDLRLTDSTQRCLFNAKRGDWLKLIIVKGD